MKRGRPAGADVLTPTEWRVADAVRHGLTNPQIASRLDVSPDAVKFHVSNCLSKLGLASRRELRLWDGVSLDSALAQHHASDDDAPPFACLAVQQIARTVGDVVASARWYQRVLGLSLLFEFPGMTFFSIGGVRLYLQAVPKPAPESILYFKVAAIHEAFTTMKAAGVEFVSAPHIIHRHADGTEEWIAIFNDPDGRPLALIASVEKVDEN